MFFTIAHLLVKPTFFCCLSIHMWVNLFLPEVISQKQQTVNCKDVASAYEAMPQ